MAITFTTLTGTNTVDESFMKWVNKQDLPSTTILTMVEKYIYRQLRVRQMTTVVTGTMTIGTATDTFPTRHLVTRSMSITGTNVADVKKRTYEQLQGLRSFDSTGAIVSGKPQFFAEDADAIHFEVLPDVAYVYDMALYREPAPLSTDTETNFLTNDMPRLLYLGGLAFANEFMKDKTERVYWLQQLDAEIAKMNRESDENLEGLEMQLEAF